MVKKIEIFRLFYYIVFSLLIAMVVGTASIWIKHLYQNFQDEVVNIREHYIDLNKSVVKKEVQSIVSYIEYRKTKLITDTEKSIANKLHEVNATSYELYNNYRDTINDHDLKDIIRTFLRASRYGYGADYVFALNSGGVLEVHPKSELEGKHFGSLDDMSTRIGDERLGKIQEEGQGFLAYAWASRMLPGESCPKLAFVKKFAPYDWWIGTGECLDIGERKLQEEILDWLNAIFVQTDGPFLVFDAKGNRLVSRDREERGANALEPAGENGLRIIREGIRTGAAPEGGFIEHDASAVPDTGNPVRMISYCMGVSGWQWTIGAGFRLDEIDAYVAGKREELADNVARSIGMTAIGLMFAVASLLVILSYFSGKMVQSLNALSSFFAKAARDPAPLEAVEMNFEEFHRIASSARRMVEERQKAEEALKKQAEFQQLMIDALPVPVFIKDSNDTYIGCNKAFEALIGRSREEVIGQTARDVLPAELAQVYRNNDVTPSRECGVAVHEAIFQDPDNRTHHALFHKAFFSRPDGSSGVIGGILDITERKRAESERMRLFAAMEQCAEAVLITDTDSTVLYVNPAFERLSGYASGEIVGKRAEIIENVENETSFSDRFREPLGIGAFWSQRVINKKEGGKTYEVEVAASPVRDENGRIVSYVSIFKDVTDRVRLQRELRQAQKMEAIGTLAGGIAHDFNNVLAAMMGFSEMARAKMPDGSPVALHLDKVLMAGNRARDLVKQILTFSRQTEQEHKPVQLVPIVKEVLKLLRSSLPSTVEIRQDLPIKPEGCIVLSEPTQIHQVLMNLCANAAHAMRAHGGVLSIGIEEFDLDRNISSGSTALTPGHYVRLTVSDTGHGMDAATLDRIFDPYFTTKMPGEGTGMGLSVVQGIMKNHGGAVSVYSEKGKGTTFHVYFPRADGEGLPHQADTQQPLSSGSERILFVDDEMGLAELGKEILESLGYDVTAKTSSTEALAVFQAAPESFDLVITDMTMPSLTGVDLARELGRVRPGLPVILCTGFSDVLNGSRPEDLGLSAILMKPYAIKTLARAIRAALPQKERGHDSPRTSGNPLERPEKPVD